MQNELSQMGSKGEKVAAKTHRPKEQARKRLKNNKN
jgi:hypothetical protein